MFSYKENFWISQYFQANPWRFNIRPTKAVMILRWFAGTKDITIDFWANDREEGYWSVTRNSRVTVLQTLRLCQENMLPRVFVKTLLLKSIEKPETLKSELGRERVCVWVQCERDRHRRAEDRSQSLIH